ncbi:bifunctional phosphoribosylaminoimidazolecarboxamide formyltransferase/IMP cyclohydrolase [Humisphaera borealis]|uniref:Bifunctional purine biosynthesis protein PurH n=1 Tax=Humisphaera borealis TaxID=2807512 RepID=A0A7M2X2E1_9BACT|nr:bifunctional phosphoribosylaminoimidazolecarboxamide formyltransferase/IMP cyclohydrolase [Humisphaera borealis]QOV91592.1 bifunctional phosphoribosylaminoimidazolecarboxamide formyltransferase/IMP cyclohydrolase [Humisphaera borealis]
MNAPTASSSGDHTGTGLVPVRRALISVSDKTGLADFATALVKEFNVELISTGGTAKFLRDAGLKVTDVSEVTGFPEMMDGRVKTLHPKIHGGLLALRDNPEHAAAMKSHDIKPIDLVVINLYPFKKTIEKPGVTFEEAIENIDIGGPSMVRSAAKNHHFVLVLTSPDRYEKALGDLRKHSGSSCAQHRLKQAQRAFAHTAEYDTLIATYLEKVVNGAGTEASQPAAEAGASSLPQNLPVTLTLKQVLRYGENPHQRGGLYVDRKTTEASVTAAIQHHGKELSYINLLDADAALNAVKELATPAACIVKHATPCGYATAADLPTAFRNAFAGDPLAAFGGIVALNKTVDLATAQAITSIDKLLEVIVAPNYAADALELLKSRWKNVRLLEVGPVTTEFDRGELMMHKIVGGYLVQERDLAGVDESQWKVVSQRQPTAQERIDLAMAWLAAKHVKSNAIAIAKDGMMLGSGAGQQDRVNACRIAIAKSGDRAKGAAVGSDAFFPFPDGPELLLDAGVTAIIHPGGSVKDQETIDLVNRRGATMVFTGQRHFRH